MAIRIVTGAKFPGVDFGTAPGDGYVIGSTPISELFRIDGDHPAELVGTKYFHHPAGDSNDNRPPDGMVRLTMLVNHGQWRQRLWSERDGQSVELVLSEPGDFIAWTPGYWHSWSAELPSTMLTISFRY